MDKCNVTTAAAFQISLNTSAAHRLTKICWISLPLIRPKGDAHYYRILFDVADNDRSLLSALKRQPFRADHVRICRVEQFNISYIHGVDVSLSVTLLIIECSGAGPVMWRLPLASGPISHLGNSQCYPGTKAARIRLIESYCANLY